MKFFPGFNLLKCISSQDKEEDILVPLPEKPNGINGVRFSRSCEFNVGGGKTGVGSGGQPHHLQPVPRFDDPLCHFVGWDGCRDEDHFLKAECLPDLFRAPKVPQMDGIECPSE